MNNREILNQVNKSNDVSTTVKTYSLKAAGMEATAEVKASGDVRVSFNGQIQWFKTEEEFKTAVTCEMEEV